MGVKISKPFSFYSSYKIFATKLLFQTPDCGPHKMFFMEFRNF